MSELLKDDYQTMLLKKKGIDRLYKLVPSEELSWWPGFIERLHEKGWTDKDIDESLVKLLLNKSKH